MPPRKDKISEEQFQALLRKCGIRFEGPASRFWPNQYKNQFQTVCNIGKIDYSHYKADLQIKASIRRHHVQRANQLVEVVYNLMKTRFDQDVVCRKCGNETWTPQVAAEPTHAENRSAVALKRSTRKECRCTFGLETSPPESSDDEFGAVFDFACQEQIEHVHGDNFGRISLPMQPDRVIGLRATKLFTQLLELAHPDQCSPIVGRNILYPFLVVEAKKEEDAPGFKAIKRQTAFPIRRLLKCQEAFNANSVLPEPPMVWFFGYQGDQWRLHVATLDNSKVRIYDLWHGTIQSQDGALQLLLLVDYICTWARDILRGTVRERLLEQCSRNEQRRQLSEERFRLPSISIASVSNSQGHVCDTETSPMDDVSPSIPSPPQDDDSEESSDDDEDSSDDSGRGQDFVRDVQLSSFLKWKASITLARPWNLMTSIQLANIVEFKFQVIRVPLVEESRKQRMRGSMSRTLFSNAVHVRKGQLFQLSTLWLNDPVPPRLPQLPDVFFATFVCQASCNPRNWRVRRQLTCFVWTTSTQTDLHARIHGNSFLSKSMGASISDFGALQRSIRNVQMIHGKESVEHAFCTLRLVLRPRCNGCSMKRHRFKWISFGALDLPSGSGTQSTEFPQKEDFDDLSVDLLHTKENTLEICAESPTNRLSKSFSPLLRNISHEMATILSRPTRWPTATPVFCLFISSEESWDSGNTIHSMLKHTLYGRKISAMLCLGPAPIKSQAIYDNIAKWLGALDYELKQTSTL